MLIEDNWRRSPESRWLSKNYHHFLLASYFTELVHISDSRSQWVYLSFLKMPWIIFPQRISLHTSWLNLNWNFIFGVYPQLEHCVICSKPVFEAPVKTEFNPKNRLYQIDVLRVRCETCFTSNSQSILINRSLVFNRWVKRWEISTFRNQANSTKFCRNQPPYPRIIQTSSLDSRRQAACLKKLLMGWVKTHTFTSNRIMIGFCL